MYKFNNDNIFTGYIKQKLASFNLPQFRIYTRANLNYRLTNGTESNEIIPSTDKQKIYYLHGNEVKIYRDNAWENGRIHYHPDIKILNYTKTLNIKNNIYDSYTHEYLGNYLRFLRDHENLDLMSMYNCFSDNICSNLTINIDTITVDATDTKYKIYMLPVKLFKDYTIAIDCSGSVELFCAVYHQHLSTITSLSTDLANKTYEKHAGTLFSQPLLYNKLAYENLINEARTTSTLSLQELATNEHDLKLFIRVPKDLSSTITVLEGDYRNYNDAICTQNTKTYNKAIINLEHINSDPNMYGEDFIFRPLSRLQLLEINTGESYPFADRLVEYLADNVITNIDEIPDNIERAQMVMSNNGIGKDKYKFDIPGAWEQRIQIIGYSKMTTDASQQKLLHYNADAFTDCLGYIDKDLEMNYSYPVKYIASNKSIEYYNVSIAQANLYPDIYKDQAEQIKEMQEGGK